MDRFIVLSESDIVVGRGLLKAKHPGNMRFYAAIEVFLSHYVAASTRQDKGKVIEAIYQSLRTQGTFVKTSSSSHLCQPVSESTAKSKIGHAIRYRLDKVQKAFKKAKKESIKQEENEDYLSVSSDCSTAADRCSAYQEADYISDQEMAEFISDLW